MQVQRLKSSVQGRKLLQDATPLRLDGSGSEAIALEASQHLGGMRGEDKLEVLLAQRLHNDDSGQ